MIEVKSLCVNCKTDKNVDKFEEVKEIVDWRLGECKEGFRLANLDELEFINQAGFEELHKPNQIIRVEEGLYEYHEVWDYEEFGTEYVMVDGEFIEVKVE